jgi:hypothetical protein
LTTKRFSFGAPGDELDSVVRARHLVSSHATGITVWRNAAGWPP